MLLVDKKDSQTYSLPTQQLKPEQAAAMSTQLAQDILSSLAKEPKYPKQLAKELKVHEQKIYYHIKNLEKNAIIILTKKETIHGAQANYYELTKPAFAISFKQFEPTQKISQTKQEHKDFLEPFIKNGQLNASIIVGSPDPHGPDKARSRDGYYGMDLALFLGTYLNYVPKINVKLDTETREEDLKQNLILIGGPIVNKVTGKINNSLPIRFNEQSNIFSTITNETYPSDESGIIVKAKNPFDKEKSILLVAGKRHSGTRASIIAFLKHFDNITSGNTKKPKIIAKVVEGIDLDSDGVVDDIEIRE